MDYFLTVEGADADISIDEKIKPYSFAIFMWIINTE